MSTYKMATTEQVRASEILARERRYNRQLPQWILDNLMPDGKHLCHFYMEHNHARGLPVPMHYRTCWKLYMNDAAILDVQMDWDAELFNELEEVTYE